MAGRRKSIPRRETCQCSTQPQQTKWRKSVIRGGMAAESQRVCLGADTTQHHRSVSDGADEWEYAYGSVRDMASFGFLFSRLA
jgi:hypothetical protein